MTTPSPAGLCPAGLSPAESPSVDRPTGRMWVPPESAQAVIPKYEFSQWVPLGQALAGVGMSSPASTTVRNAGVWGDETALGLAAEVCRPSPIARLPERVRAAVWVVNAGIAVEDLFALASVYVRVGSRNPAPQMVAHTTLGIARTFYREFTVRDMVGWLLVGDALEDSDERATVRRAKRWADRGLPSGWLYAAAGLTPGEETEIGPDQVRLMAALRGATLPVG